METSLNRTNFLVPWEKFAKTCNTKYHMHNCLIVINVLPIRKQRFLLLVPYRLITSFHCMILLFVAKMRIISRSIQDQNLWKIHLMELILVLKQWTPWQILFKDFLFGINDRTINLINSYFCKYFLLAVCEGECLLFRHLKIQH